MRPEQALTQERAQWKEDQDLEAGENGRPKKQSGRVPRIQVRPSAKRRDDTNSIEAV